MNIILIGFMGSGKTVVGHELAQKLGFEYLDTDELIEKQSSTSISQIFSEKGEEHFRELETQVLQDLKSKDKLVISTGGGMVLKPENVKILKGIGSLVLLWANPEKIYSRVKDEPHRPLLKVEDPKAKIEEILKFREPIYKKVADLVVDTSNLSVEQVVEEILKWQKLR